jgi:hypothetical protein
MVYHTVATAFLHGDIATILDGSRLTDAINREHASWLQVPLVLHPWIYPPLFLVVLLPFGLLPFGPAYVAFMLSTFAALAGSLCLWLRTPMARAAAVAAMLFCPATAFTVGVGQNAFLTSALIVAGTALLPRRPAAAGFVLGMLALKPQLALMVPVALIAGREWQALAAAAAGVFALVLASILLGGFDLWIGWFGFMLGQDAAYSDWLVVGRMHGDSIYTSLRLLGASPAVASGGQAAAVLAAAACVWTAFRQRGPQAMRLVVLLAATSLAAPHVSLYDFVMLGAAAVIMLAYGAASSGGFMPGELLVAALVWISTAVSLPAVWYPGMATPLVILALIACALRRGWTEAASGVRAALP